MKEGQVVFPMANNAMGCGRRKINITCYTSFCINSWLNNLKGLLRKDFYMPCLCTPTPYVVFSSIADSCANMQCVLTGATWSACTSPGKHTARHARVNKASPVKGTQMQLGHKIKRVFSEGCQDRNHER